MRFFGLGSWAWAALAALLLSTAGGSQAGNWPGRRGPTGMGYCDETDLPLHGGSVAGVRFRPAVYRLRRRARTGHRPHRSGRHHQGAQKWKIDKTPASYAYASPGISGDYIYRVQKPGMLHCWKLSTGELLYVERLKGLTNLASPVATPDGRVYFLTSATSYVIQAGPKLKVLAKNDLGVTTATMARRRPSPTAASTCATRRRWKRVPRT